MNRLSVLAILFSGIASRVGTDRFASSSAGLYMLTATQSELMHCALAVLDA